MLFFNDVESLPISYLRQYKFCPRIPWYKHVSGVETPEQSWMLYGKKWHSEQENLQKRRLSYLKGEVTRKTNFYVSSKHLKLHGYLDEIVFNDRQLVVIEYKLDKRAPTIGQKLQLCAYSLCAEEVLGLKSEYGVMLKGSAYKQRKISINKGLIDILKSNILELRKILKTPRLPISSASASKCAQCEYLRYCNDR